MKTNKKIVFSISVIVLISIIVLALFTFGKNDNITSETAKESFSYTVLDDSIIVDNYIGEDSHVVIPSHIDDIKVTSIGPDAFSGKNIEVVDIPETVTTINVSAFKNCSELKDIELPDSLEFLGAYAFYGCKNIKKIAIPDNVTIICTETFSGCTSLKKVDLNKQICEIGEGAFKGSGIDSISLPESLLIIRHNAFSDCANLKKVKLPDSLKSITNNSFDYENVEVVVNNNESVKKFVDGLNKTGE